MREPAPMHVSISGPLHGLFVASYACPVGELGERFVGYYRVYAREPHCYCDAGAWLDGVADGSFASPDAALRQAFAAAEGNIDRRPYGAPYAAPQEACCSCLPRIELGAAL